MAVLSFSQSVTTTRAAVTVADQDSSYGSTIWLYGEYHGNSKKIAFGGSDVTISTGIHLYAGEKFGPIHLAHGETLYVISDEAAGLDLRVLAVGA